MKQLCVGVLVLALAVPARAADPALPLLSAQGTVTKVDVKKTGGTLVVQPVGQDGKPAGRPIELTVTGTSDFVAVGTRKTGDKLTVMQRKIEGAELKQKQVVSVTYTRLGNELVLLYAAVLPMD
jgi:hypothetical protein